MADDRNEARAPMDRLGRKDSFRGSVALESRLSAIGSQLGRRIRVPVGAGRRCDLAWRTPCGRWTPRPLRMSRVWPLGRRGRGGGGQNRRDGDDQLRVETTVHRLEAVHWARVTPALARGDIPRSNSRSCGIRASRADPPPRPGVRSSPSVVCAVLPEPGRPLGVCPHGAAKRRGPRAHQVPRPSARQLPLPVLRCERP